MKIKKVSGREILDSRGNPTVEVDGAATELYENGAYVFHKAGGLTRSAAKLVELYRG